MNEKMMNELVLEYLKEDLTPEREKELESILASQGYKLEELREMRGYYIDLGGIALPEPGGDMSGRFYAMLEEEKSREARKGLSGGDILARTGRTGKTLLWRRIAAAAVLVLLGWTAAYWIPPGGGSGEKFQYMASEITEMRKMMMFSMLNRSSAAERLQAIQYLKDLAPADEQVLTALLDIFERDPNVNVRLTTLDALAALAGDERIRESFINAIGEQDSPAIQLALIDLMVSMNEKRAVEPFRHLLERKDLNIFVRDRINESLRFL